ncbi:hypothetical protein Gohar_002290, partial [Gossypium harknessii]|nr:hypothetical protein [Gossypium harknessii]
RATKKVRTRSDFSPDTDDPTTDKNRQKVQNSDNTKVSYKSMLTGALLTPSKIFFMEEEFALLDGDVVTEVVDGVSSITFSNRVQEYIVHK